MAVYIHQRLGAPYGGSCIACGHHTGSAPDQRAVTSLYQDEASGRPRVAHPECVGGSTTRIDGVAVYAARPRDTVDSGRWEVR